MTIRIAMWSGPRNISTAMMRAWENRPDCQVIDEPLYGYYLNATGIDHPGASQVIEAQGTEWQSAVKRCLAPTMHAEEVFFQKHMVMHMLPAVSREWLAKLTHCFLIREPTEVIASYSAVRENLTLEDVGYPQMTALYEDIETLMGYRPIVIDSAEFLKQPAAHLQALCDVLKVPFDDRMLAWPKGRRASDGVWAPYWYSSVEQSTAFAPYQKRQPVLSPMQQQLAAKAQAHYQLMKQHALKV